MNSQFEHPPYGEIPAIDGEGAIRIHTTSGTTGKGPLRALDSRKDWAWIAEMWAYGIWGCGVRPARHRLHRVRLRVVHRLLGAALLDGEDRRAERARRRADDRGARAPDRRLRRHRRRLDPDLRAAARPGGVDARHRPPGLGRRAPDPVRRARRLDPADQGADRGAVGREGVRHRRDDRDRDDHGVRVRPSAGRHPHHRGPRDRGGDRSGVTWSRSATASAASGS